MPRPVDDETEAEDTETEGEEEEEEEADSPRSSKRTQSKRGRGRPRGSANAGLLPLPVSRSPRVRSSERGHDGRRGLESSPEAAQAEAAAGQFAWLPGVAADLKRKFLSRDGVKSAY